MALELKIYQKENRTKLFKLLKDIFYDIYSSRFLSKQLAVRDIKALYRQSYLGVLWAFITPISTALVWVFLNMSGTIKLTDTGIPYPVHAFSGTLLWSIILDSINAPIKTTMASKGILSKVNFPKEALLISGIYKLLFDSGIKIVLLFVFLQIYGIGFHTTLFLFPFTLLGIIIFGTTIGLLFTPLGLLYKDISRIITFGLGLIMYITPVVFALPKEGFMLTLMKLNPFTPLILTTRDLILGNTPEFLTYYLCLIVVTIPLLFFGLLFYRISIPVLVERINS